MRINILNLSNFSFILAVFVFAAFLVVPCSVYAEDGLITAENWTEMVSFKPNLSAGQFDTGTIIDKKNYKKYRKFLPKTLMMLISKYNLKMRLTEYQPVFPSDGYIEATNKNRGKAKIIDLGKSYDKRGIKGYIAGLPFPKAKNGLEVAWNLHYAYSADDGQIIYSVYWVSSGSGVENTEVWRLSMLKATHRTEIDPMPEIDFLAKRGLQGAGLTAALSPYDKRGLGALYFRHVEPRDGQGHVYVPSMRRILRNTFGTRGDSWNSTDLFYEDVRGYSGYPEWMRWKLLGKVTALLPMHSGVRLGKNTADKFYDFKNWPHWNPKYTYEPRPVYLLESRPKLPDYPYSKQYLFVDAESFRIIYKEAYDKKGDLWKVMINSGSFHVSDKTGNDVMGWSGTVVIDMQSEHATVFHVHKSRGNIGLNPRMFTLSTLRKQGK